jgi:predicted GTPase
MAQELARFYHPSAADPVERLTIPEILAVTELAAHDLTEMVDQYLPGGHLLTIRNWRQASRVGEWYTRASNVYWAISAVFSPINTAVRYSASKLGLSRPFQMLQANVLAWFYTAFVHRVGTYLIDLNSGRLRIGAKRYRELLHRRERIEAAAQSASGGSAPPDAADSAPALEPPEATPYTTTLAILGQVKAGKSSLINALLGERRAVTDVLPATSAITRYQLRSPAPPSPSADGQAAKNSTPSQSGDEKGGGGDMRSELDLLDTVGYGHEGPKADQLAATHEAVRQADLALLVLNARDPGRQADLELLTELQQWFSARPHLKMPRILGVVTHIDLLSPLMEWSPPYNWLNPKRPKEKNIADAVAVIRDQLGAFLVDVVPVCTAEGRVFGIQEALLPSLAEQLDEARAVAMLRCLHAEADAGKVRKVFQQLLEAAKQLMRAARGK